MAGTEPQSFNTDSWQPSLSPYYGAANSSDNPGVVPRHSADWKPGNTTNTVPWGLPRLSSRWQHSVPIRMPWSSAKCMHSTPITFTGNYYHGAHVDLHGLPRQAYVRLTDIASCSRTFGKPKRRAPKDDSSNSDGCPPVKEFITEEKMAEKMRGLAIGNRLFGNSNLSPLPLSSRESAQRILDEIDSRLISDDDECNTSDNDDGSNKNIAGQRLEFAPEVNWKITSDILPKKFVQDLKRPCLDVVLWRPPGDIITSVIHERLSKCNEKVKNGRNTNSPDLIQNIMHSNTENFQSITEVSRCQGPHPGSSSHGAHPAESRGNNLPDIINIQNTQLGEDEGFDEDHQMDLLDAVVDDDDDMEL